MHGLRHTHASILLYQGVNILSVSKRLGHSSLETTMSTYLHIVRELEDQDKEKINAVFDSLNEMITSLAHFGTNTNKPLYHKGYRGYLRS